MLHTLLQALFAPASWWGNRAQSRSVEPIMESKMTTKLQFYLIASPNIPQNFYPFSEDIEVEGKEFRGRLDTAFGPTLTPLGENPLLADIKVPADTKFAGIAWGDGEHFDDEGAPTWGVLGEIERLGPNEYLLWGMDGTVIGEFSDVGDDWLPEVMPPEAFGLTRSSWWNKRYHWCQ